MKTRPAVSFIKEWSKNKSLIGAEVGVGEGENALDMLETMPNLTKLYLIDPYQGYLQEPNEWMSQQRIDRAMLIASISLCSFQKRIEWKIQEFKKGLIDKPLDFIYIDADHHYSAVLHDIKIASGIVRYNGIISGHDLERNSVKKAVDDFCQENSIKRSEKGHDWWFFNKEDSFRS